MSGLIESTYELPRAFLEALFPPRPLAEHYIEIRTLPSRAQAFATPGDEDALTELQKFVRRHAGENIYFGVATRAEQAGTLAGGAKHCVESRALWIDLDFKDTPEPEARALLADFPLEPSFVVQSGGGLHVYWLLKEALAADRLKPWLRRLARALRADLQATDPARILRLPGLPNRKYDPPRPVVIELFEPERRYGLEDFAWLPEEPAETETVAPRTPTRSLGVVNADKAVYVLAAVWPDGRRHEFTLSVAGWFAHNGVAEEDAVAIIRAAEETSDSKEPAEPDDRERAVRDSYRAHASGEPVTGFPRAAEIVPALHDVAHVLTDALGIVPIPAISVTDLDQDLPEAPTILALPADARIGLAARYADLYAEAFESPWEAFFFGFLTHLGARVAKRVRLDNALLIEPRSYTLLIGPSARGRKTQAIKIVTRVDQEREAARSADAAGCL